MQRTAPHAPPRIPNPRDNQAMKQSLHLWRRLVPAYAAGYFLSYNLRSINAVIAPELMHDLGITATGLGLLTSAYFLSFGLFQLPLGLLLDRYGPRRVEAALLLIAAAGCVLFGLGTTLSTLVVARALIGRQGMPCVSYMPCSGRTFRFQKVRRPPVR